MTFEKGDMARRVRNGNEHCPVGAVVEVTAFEKGRLWYKGQMGEEVWGVPENFELASPPLVTVETRTVHTINPGVHGRLRVVGSEADKSKIFVAINPESRAVPEGIFVPVNADELDALAAQFKALAEALRNAAE